MITSPPLRPELYAGEPRATSSTSTPLFTPNVSRRSAFVRTMVAPAMTIGADPLPEITYTLRRESPASVEPFAAGGTDGAIGAGVGVTVPRTTRVGSAGGASSTAPGRRRTVVTD